MVYNFRKFFLLFLLIALLFFTHDKILASIGSFLVVQDVGEHTEAAVVLNTGVDIYPRLIEAADLYNNKKSDRVVINGNRKTDVLRKLEAKGFKPPCKWHAEEIKILDLLGVPKDNIIAISAENAYDTISEAKIVGNILVNNGIKKIVITTSKFHTRRARHIWTELYDGKLQVYAAAAKNDPFNPKAWWKDGRQIRWVLAEYGAWLYYYWQSLVD
jgi:uncharacterized SAM-binding protein YcdF (DUF218 family)